MKTSLFFFSGTGNCLQVARDLAGELGDTEVISIPRVMNGSAKIEDSAAMGIVF